MHHPHLHCVVSGGGLSQDGNRWLASKPHYFLPVKVLSRVFRNKFRALLQQAFQRGELEFFGELQPLADSRAFEGYLAAATTREWVVYAKRPFRDATCVLKYLARYTHRVAISNARLLGYRDGKVLFRYKDYAHESQQRTMTVPASEFIRRFLLHVLPDGFMRIRHYGYLANRHRRERLETCRRLLGCAGPSPVSADMEQPQSERCEGDGTAESTIRCPACKTGRMRIIDTFGRLPRHCHGSSAPLPSHPAPSLEDSS
jgi:hypothetical protein